MSKKPEKKAVKYDGPMTHGMKFFLAGCVAQLYLLIVNRFYVYGTMDQVLAWLVYLKVFIGVGLAAAVAGAVMVFTAKKQQREKAWYLLGGGVFLAAATALVHWNMEVMPLLTTAVPAVLVIDVLWWLFDRESALSLTVLSLALLAAWVNRRADAMTVKALTVAVAGVIGAAAVLVKQGKVRKVAGGGLFYAACSIAAVCAVAAMVSGVMAYYAVWALAAALFCMAVYLTVKQL